MYLNEEQTEPKPAGSLYFNAVGIKDLLVPGICYLIRSRIRLVGTTNENQRKNNTKNN
jgi:hypothetical protein